MSKYEARLKHLKICLADARKAFAENNTSAHRVLVIHYQRKITELEKEGPKAFEVFQDIYG